MSQDGNSSAFWKSQPVGIAATKNPPGIIDGSKAKSTTPVQLPTGLQWHDMPRDNTEEMQRLRTFLANNYVVDPEETFRLGYSAEFLSLFLSEGHPTWSVAITENGKMVGYIAAVKRRVCLMRENVEEIAEVNFLCVEGGKRGQALAALLIKEITRRVNLCDIFIAIFTCGTRLPSQPFASSRYYHKFLDLKTLNEIGFTSFSQEEFNAAKKKWQHKHVAPRINSSVARAHILRPLKENDISTVVDLFSHERHLYAIVEVMDKERLENQIKSKFLQHFVVEELDVISRTRKIVGYIATVDSQLIVLEKDTKIELRTVETATIHYQCGTVSPAINQLFTLLQRQGKCVVNALTIASNMLMIKQENFCPGTGELYYHMYNYRLPVLQPYEVNYHVF